MLLAWWLVAPAWGAGFPGRCRTPCRCGRRSREGWRDPASLSEGLSRLWDRALGYVEEAVSRASAAEVVLLAAAVLCALTEECMDAAGGGVHFVPMAGALAITLAAAGSVKTMMGLGQETVEELNTFSKALLPLSPPWPPAGHRLRQRPAGGYHFFVDLLLSLIRGLLLPLGVFLCGRGGGGRHAAGAAAGGDQPGHPKRAPCGC